MVEIRYCGVENPPKFATDGSAAFDLLAAEDMVVHFGQILVVPLNLRTTFPLYKVALILEKSGLALKGVDVKAGVIDPDYPLEWGVIIRYLPSFELDKHGMIRVLAPQTLGIAKGSKIAQMILLQNDTRFVSWKAVEAIEQTTQRVGGFGST